MREYKTWKYLESPYLILTANRKKKSWTLLISAYFETNEAILRYDWLDPKVLT